MYNFIKKREHGSIKPLKLERAETTRREYNLQLSQRKELALSHRGKKESFFFFFWRSINNKTHKIFQLGGVNSIKIENIDQR
jgi:hypothetical protein